MKKATIGIPLVLLISGCEYELKGVDLDGNGIRDDYEEKIMSEDFQDVTRDAALWAGSVYGKAMLTQEEVEETSQTEALSIINELIAVRYCKQWILENYGETWKETYFYNNSPRFEAKISIPSILYRKIDKSAVVLPNEPCEYQGEEA